MSLNSVNSFNEIYNTYYRKSFLYVKSYVHEDMAAEDIVSESLIRLWQQMKQQPIDPIPPFLFTILKNRSPRLFKTSGCNPDSTSGNDRNVEP